MNKFILALSTIGIALTTVAPAHAAINFRQLNQQRLIDAGLRSGKLRSAPSLALAQARCSAAKSPGGCHAGETE
jgi:hypothetical protein